MQHTLFSSWQRLVILNGAGHHFHRFLKGLRFKNGMTPVNEMFNSTCKANVKKVRENFSFGWYCI